MRGRSLPGWRTAGFYVFIGTLAVRLLLIPFFDFCVDDAYITFRVAGNVAGGLGMVFNQGSRVLVTSTPLYALLMVPGELVGIGSPLWSKLLNSLAVATACLLIHRLLQGKVRRGILVLVLAGMALSPMSIFMSLTGMESPVVYLLLLAATILFRDERGTWLGLVLGACFLVRPEGAFAAALFWLAVLVFRRKLIWRVTIPLAAVAAGWLIYSFTFFDSPLPHSLVAKSAFFSVYVTPVRNNLKMIARILWLIIPLFPILAVTLPLGVWSIARRHREFIPMCTWVLIVLTAQVFSGFNLPWWYVDQLAPLLLVVLALGVEWALENVLPAGAGAFFRRRPVVVLVMATALVSGFLVNLDMTDNYIDARINDVIMGDLGRWFTENDIPHDRTIGVEAIGRLGYESGLRILDTFGLASPEMIPLIEAGTIDDEMILRIFRPDYYISGQVLDPETNGGYRPIAEIRTQPLRRIIRNGGSAELGVCFIYSVPADHVQPDPRRGVEGPTQPGAHSEFPDHHI